MSEPRHSVADSKGETANLSLLFCLFLVVHQRLMHFRSFKSVLSKCQVLVDCGLGGKERQVGFLLLLIDENRE